ncbi:Hpt domain-containing protein [filamentous cyanobacterium CCP5]|nr:Hpt domain-containing protein [filamentous cyanobacterium CCP5]
METVVMQKDWNQLIDYQQLSNLSGGDRGFEAELLSLYVRDTLEQLQPLEQAVAAANAASTRNIAHHIKGASANVGAIAIASTAADIEAAAHHGSLDNLTPYLTRLRQQIDALQASLR